MAKGKSGAAKAKKSKKTGKGTTTVPEEPIVKSVRENLLSVAQRAADEFGVPADELLDATFSAVSSNSTFMLPDLPSRDCSHCAHLARDLRIDRERPWTYC